jgi:membrane protease YdiL (CAAX protease family)
MAYSADRVHTTGYTQIRQWWPGYFLAGLLLVLGVVGGLLLGGPLGQFMLSSIQILPFALLALLTYLGLEYILARVFAFLWLGILLMGIALVGILSALAMLMARGNGLNPGSGLALPPGAGGMLGSVVLWQVLGFVVAGLALVPGVRRAVARVLPIDPESVVHAIALSLVSGATVMGFGQLIAVGGSPPLLEMVQNNPDLAGDTSDLDQLLLIAYGFVWTFPGALVAVGFTVVRTFSGALQRLGLVRPTGRQVLAAIVIAVLLVAGGWLLDAGIGWLWDTMGWQRTNAEAFDQLLGAAISPIGAVLIGVTAGLGEEMVVRGALQPRLGLLLSNLFFVSLHAFQYSFDALLSVFIVGMVLGIVRARSNTTTSSIVHGLYDFILVMISALALFS